MEGIILSFWDHIMGPQIEKLWLIPDNSSENIFIVPDNILHDFNVSKYCKEVNKIENIDLSAMKVYTIMCGQLLLSEVDSWKSSENGSSRLYMSENKILMAILFHLNCWKCSSSSRNMKKVCLCFGILFKSEIYDGLLLNHLLIDHHLRKVVELFTNSQIPVGPSLMEISIMVANIIELLVSMETINLIRKTSLIPSFQNSVSINIIPQAIVSHLKSSGCTAVVGGSNFHINQMISLLALFSPQVEHSCSFTSPQQRANSKIMGLYVYCRSEDSEVKGKELLEKAIKELYSLTVVDLDAHKVWCTIPFQDCTKSCKNSISIISETGCLVPNLISDLIFLEKSKKDCRECIKTFCHILTTKACSLIEIIEHSRYLGKFLTKKEVMAMLGMLTSVDLEILLGFAEKMKAGIRNFIIE